jgi:hypothetical protein
MSKPAPNGRGRGGRGPRLQRILCRLKDSSASHVEVVFIVGRRDSDQVLEFRWRNRTGHRVAVKVEDILQATVGNVELARALDGVELKAGELTQAVDRVRDSRQFHLFERDEEGCPLTVLQTEERMAAGVTPGGPITGGITPGDEDLSDDGGGVHCGQPAPVLPFPIFPHQLTNNRGGVSKTTVNKGTK